MLEALRTEIQNAVTAFFMEPAAREAMLRVLERPGFALHTEGPCRAGMLTLLVCKALYTPASNAVISGASGVELQMEAAFMFDHVADNELDPTNGLDAAEELALAIGLQSCGAALASKAAHQVMLRDPSTNPLLQFHSDYISACGGQFLDAYLQKRGTASVEEALRMTTGKSGSLGRFACGFGAHMATDNPAIVQAFSEFGYNLLTYMQLIDDLRDACPGEGSAGDILQRKQTVPLIYFYHSLIEDTVEQQESSSSLPKLVASLVAQGSAAIQQAFVLSGAPVFTAVVAETYLNEAKAQLAALRGQGAKVDDLEQFLQSLEISGQEVFPNPNPSAS